MTQQTRTSCVQSAVPSLLHIGARGSRQRSGRLALKQSYAQGVNNGGVVNTTPPTITYPSPSPGVSIVSSTVLTVEVVDPVALALVFIKAIYAGQPSIDEVVFDGINFGPSYQGPTNVRLIVNNGYQFNLLRDGGWPGTPSLLTTAVDTAGNKASA